jgi:hypothetical protein
MTTLYPIFNAAEAEVVASLSDQNLAVMTDSLRQIVTDLDGDILE